jgi:hypothetical protein
VPTLIGLALHLTHTHRFYSGESNGGIFLGLAVTALCIIKGTSRAVHPDPVLGKVQYSDAVKPHEARSVPLLVGSYNLVLLALLP